MITCKLQGGLGNQMFQIAATYSLALDNNDDCCFDFNKGFFVQQLPTTYLDNLFRKLKYGTLPNMNIYSEKDFSYNTIPYSNNICLDGYFQSEKYFNHNRKQILDLFNLDTDIKLPVSGETVSLHIRRGDYINMPDFHPVCSLDYYQEALSKFNDKEYTFIIFSDDIEWCKQNFDDNFIISDGKTDYEDMWLMSLCTHNIISNSTFSWWSAWLNKNDNKKVIAPKKWFGSAISHNTMDLYPKGWDVI